MGRRKGSIGYWNTEVYPEHVYERKSIKYDFLKFCGWEILEKIIKDLEPLHSALVCALFETGGRATEVLTLRPEQFDIRGYHVMVLRMPVLKRREGVDRTFPIPVSDPLLGPLLSYVETIEDGQRLFPFKYGKLYKIVSSIKEHGPWWPQRFRGERATQLVVEKKFGVFHLMEWFGWAREETPTFYVSLNPEDLIKIISERD